MTAQQIYEHAKGFKLSCPVRKADGTFTDGFGVVCGYQENWLILGFDTEEKGCIKSFADHVVVDAIYPSYRFWNIKHLIKQP